MTQNQKMRDFVKSLENNQFNKEQVAMLLVRKADTLQAGSNGECENRSSSCDRLSFGFLAAQLMKAFHLGCSGLSSGSPFGCSGNAGAPAGSVISFTDRLVTVAVWLE